MPPDYKNFSEPSLSPKRGPKRSILGEFRLQVVTLSATVSTLWGLEIVDQLIFQNVQRYGLDRFGIIPRTVEGLRGIVFAPLLHGDFAHLIANTVPLIVLGWLIMLRGVGDWLLVTVITAVAGGFGTWLIGDIFRPGLPGLHIGASGVIFGYFGFLLARGYFERSFVSIGFSVLVAFLYGGIIFGVLPGQPGISWEGHLCGFLGGVLAAWLLTKPRQKTSDFDL